MAEKRRYEKPALTYEQQLQKLRGRGMEVECEQEALRALSQVSYYRLSAYWYPFRVRHDHGNVQSELEPGTSFNQIVELYNFDRKLRSQVLEGLEQIEILVRTKLSYYIGHTYDAFGHLNPRNFHPKFNHAEWLQRVTLSVEESSDEFLKHFQRNYRRFPDVPIWMLTEVMSMGALSRLYKGMQNDKKKGHEDKQMIANEFNMHYRQLQDWLHVLTYVRNVCAHHSRLWNRELAIRPERIRNANWLPPLTPRNDRVFVILLMINRLLSDTLEIAEWTRSIENLLTPHSNNRFVKAAMGIPDNWQKHPLWT